MDAATELLKEGVPADAPVSKGIRRKSAVKGGLPALFSSLGEGTASDRRFPAYTLLYRGPSRILAGKSGHIELFFKDIALTPPAFPSAFPKVRPDIFFETENETGGFLNGSCRFFSDGGQLGFSKEGKTKGEAHILAGELLSSCLRHQGGIAGPSLLQRSGCGMRLFGKRAAPAF